MDIKAVEELEEVKQILITRGKTFLPESNWE